MRRIQRSSQKISTSHWGIAVRAAIVARRANSVRPSGLSSATIVALGIHESVIVYSRRYNACLRPQFVRTSRASRERQSQGASPEYNTNRGRSLAAGVQLVDLFLEVLHGSSAPHLHRRRQLALLDAEIARENAVLTHLLERRQVFIHARHRFLNLSRHRLGLRNLLDRPAAPCVHPLNRLGVDAVDREQRGQIRETVAHQQDLTDQRLHLEQAFHTRWIYFLPRR